MSVEEKVICILQNLGVYCEELFYTLVFRIFFFFFDM